MGQVQSKKLVVNSWLLNCFFLACLFFTQVLIATEGGPLTYTDPKWGYTVEIPNGWRASNPDGTSRVVVFSQYGRPQTHQSRVIISVLTDDLKMPDTEKELNLFLPFVVGPNLKMPGISKLRVIESGIQKKQAQRGFYYKTSYEIQPSNDSKTEQMMSLNRIMEIEKVNFGLSLVAPKKGFENDEKIFQNVVDSLTLPQQSKKGKKKKS